MNIIYIHTSLKKLSLCKKIAFLLSLSFLLPHQENSKLTAILMKIPKNKETNLQ